MPAFDAAVTADAPPEEVWKLLYDPARFPEWWDGVGSVDADRADGFTMYPDGYPDFPMPQDLRTNREASRVEISCLVSDLVFTWTLTEVEPGPRTGIAVHVELPEAEAHRLAGQRLAMERSLANLARLAASA